MDILNTIRSQTNAQVEFLQVQCQYYCEGNPDEKFKSRDRVMEKLFGIREIKFPGNGNFGLKNVGGNFGLKMSGISDIGIALASPKSNYHKFFEITKLL